MARDYSPLFEPIKLGPVEVKNRIFQPSYASGLVGKFDHVPHEKGIQHRVAKAKGGFGLIMYEICEVHPTTDYTPVAAPSIYDPASLSNIGKLADEVHKYGCKIFLQLWHGGQRVMNYGTMLPRMAPSSLPDHIGTQVPKEMEKEDIREIVGAYGNAAEIAEEAGCDGVEFHATHSYLPNQFLSPFYNKRKDEYGGDLEGRTRFSLECLEQIRKSLSDKMVVGIRLNANEGMPGGLTPSDSAEIAEIFLEEGLIDYLSLSTGTYHSLRPWIFGPAKVFDENYQLDSVLKVKEELGGEVQVPVLGAGRIKDPDSAAKIVKDGRLDMVGLARQSMADPYWPNKVKGNRVGEIRECIGCNKCLSMLGYERGFVGCTQNPTVGEEGRWPPEEFDEADEEKMILVVGAGPAGMEFGIVAANRGHMVHVNEAKGETGGRVRLESRLPGFEERGRIKDCRETMLERHEKAELRLNAEMDFDSIRDYGADIVVMATGSTFDRRGTHPLTLNPTGGYDKEHVLIPEDIILDGSETGEKVVVLDEWGYIEGVGIAEHLARKGKDVFLSTSRMILAERLVPTVEVFQCWSNLNEFGVRTEEQMLPLAINEDSVTLLNLLTRESITVDADNVILTTSRMPNDGLYRRLKGELGELRKETEIENVLAIGDCVSTRDVLEAIYDGHRLGREI